MGGPASFTPELVCDCNRIAMRGIYATASSYRTEPVLVASFNPPQWRQVPVLMADMCEHVNSLASDPFHCAAYVLWRINWIHPFYDGNGRVARELSYLALLTALGLPGIAGKNVLPGLLQQEKDECFAALAEADKEWARENPRALVRLENLLHGLMLECW